MVLSQDRDKGRVALSTRKLERTKGDMLRDPQKVGAVNRLPFKRLALAIGLAPNRPGLRESSVGRH
jgi:hypothetical protein